MMIGAIILLTWIIPFMVVLTAVALLVAFVMEGFQTLFVGSGRRLPAFREEAGLQWGELDQYIDELLGESGPVGDSLNSLADKSIPCL